MRNLVRRLQKGTTVRIGFRIGSSVAVLERLPRALLVGTYLVAFRRILFTLWLYSGSYQKMVSPEKTSSDVTGIS